MASARFPRRGRQLAKVVILFVLPAALATIGWLRFEQGYLTADSALAALAFIGWFGLPPILVFVLLWRWSGRPMETSEKLATPRPSSPGWPPPNWRSFPPPSTT